MTMTTMMKKTDAQSVPPTVPALPTRVERSRKFSGIANSGPTLPTRDEYRDGMNKLRVKIDCPVLGCPQEQLAKELTELPSLRVDLADDAADAEQRASTKRKTVAEYLKERHREEMFKRWPQFEQDTQDQLSRMSAEIDSLIFKLFITNLIIAIAIVIGSISWVF